MTLGNLFSRPAIFVFAVALSGLTFAAKGRVADAEAVEDAGLAKLPVLGQDRDAVIQRCGKPLEEKTLGGTGGIDWMRFQVGEFRLIVEIAPTTKKVVQIYHFRKSPYNDAEIARLLDRNAQGKQWTAERKAEYGWKRSDGATTRGGGPVRFDGMNAQEWQFTVLDPTWRNRP